MSDHKRKRDATEQDLPSSKKAKRGFTVGPANLPDGVHKRKTQKIKTALIQRARIKKNYAKLKRQGKIPDEPRRPNQAIEGEVEEDQPESQEPEPSTAPHPDRQTLMDKTTPEPEGQPAEKPDRRQRKPKSVPFKREQEQAQKRKAEAEERRKAREEAERQRQQKIDERERFRRSMAKARTGGPNGQRKLGRESNVLLEKVKKMVGERV